MSLEKKSIHVRIDPDMHKRVSILAGLESNDIAEHVAILLEEAIMGKWHIVNIQLERMKRLGLTGNDRDSSHE